ncbi:MAG: hypothetical protein M1816_006894 [Peltula sp. TS41687]|nr:MAG: hypothetical protein M1816_006894 [Peltula sp. TS41687]
MKFQQLALVTLVASLTTAKPVIRIKVSITDDASPQHGESLKQQDRSLFLSQKGSHRLSINDDEPLSPKYAECQLLCVPESKLDCPKDMVLFQRKENCWTCCTASEDGALFSAKKGWFEL